MTMTTCRPTASRNRPWRKLRRWSGGSTKGRPPTRRSATLNPVRRFSAYSRPHRLWGSSWKPLTRPDGHPLPIGWGEGRGEGSLTSIPRPTPIHAHGSAVQNLVFVLPANRDVNRSADPELAVGVVAVKYRAGLEAVAEMPLGGGVAEAGFNRVADLPDLPGIIDLV